MEFSTTMADLSSSKPGKIHAFGQLSLFGRSSGLVLPPLTNTSGTELHVEAETMYTVEGRDSRCNCGSEEASRKFHTTFQRTEKSTSA